MKRAWLILLPLFISISLVVGAYMGIKPSLRQWVKTQLEAQIEQKSPLKITIQDFNWKLLWPSIWLEGIEIPEQSLSTDLGIKHLKMGKVLATLDPFSILLGRFSLAAIEIQGLEVSLEADAWNQTSSQPKELQLKPLFDILKKLPISQIATFQAQANLSSGIYKSSLQVKDFSLVASNKKTSLELDLVLRGATLASHEQELPLSLLVSSELTQDRLSLRDFQLHVLNSYLEAKADFTKVSELFLKPQGSVQWELFADLYSLKAPLEAFTGLKNLQGQLKVESDLKFKGTNFEKSKADVLGKNLEINQFRVGDINFAVNFNQSSIEVPEIQLTNSAGLLDLKKLRISLKDGIELEQAQVKTDFIDLHEFLKLLGVGDLPLEAFLEADFDCAGPLRPAFKITCSGGFTGSELEVRSGPGIKNTIVQISSYGAQGTVEIDSQKVSYQAKLQIADDQGLSSGEISFQDGFKINYSAENFKLENFKHLAGLQLQGLSKLSGQTEGNSSTATFFVDLQGRDVLFEDFYLGEASTRISYKKSLLSFEKLQGLVDKTNYRGDLQVNLKEGTIQGTANSDLFEISSVLKVFEKIFQLPFEMMGTGQFTTRFSGPLRLGALSYDLDVNLNSGEALGESFDRVEFQISSNAGNAKIKKAFLQKGKARISLSGSSDPRGNLDWKVSSDQLYLEESENINRLGAGITGLIKFDMTLRDHILKPLLDLNLEVSQLLLNEQEFPSSQLQLRTTSGSLTGTADLFSGKLTSSFHFPLSNQGHFELDMTANNWNFTTLFALIGGADLLSDYQAGVTGQIKLRADTGGVFQSTGSGRIQNLFLKRGNLSVQNQGEMRLTMNQGVAQLENFKVLGENSSLEVLGDAISEQSLGLTIRGQTQLRLLQIFVPFIEDLSGQAQLNMKVSGPLLKPQVLGDAQVKSGFAKLKGFPHPFERVESLVQFSQNKIVISSLKGFIAGGTLQGDGNISIEGPRNLPTRVTARLENVTFNVPERIRTSGRADVVFSGQWFPFTLSGSYRVNQGFIDKEFGGSEFSGGLKQSSYLPKVILQSAFEPLLLDLNVILDRPLQIKNSLMEGQVSGQLAVRGPPANPLLFGQINIEKNSKLLFRDTPFEVSSGTINFKDTKEINPELYISARTRKNEYDINLLVQGTAKDPLLRPSSLPALSESDIFSLLALGITSAGLEKRIESAQQESSVSTAVVGDILSNTPLVKSVQEQTGFNIQISSQYDDTKNVAVRKYTVSRKVTDRVNVSASRLEGAQKSNEVKVQYQLNSNWSTVGTWESKQPSEETQDLTNTRSEEQDSTLGLDLEFKREFR